MLPPEAEERFRKIEDNLVVAGELLHRFTRASEERLGFVELVQAETLEWRREVQQWMRADHEWKREMEHKFAALVDAHIKLAETVDRFLKSRTNGGSN